MADEIVIARNAAESRYEARLAEAPEGAVAIAEFEPIDGGVVFTHTEVPEALGGRGIATKLVEAALADARLAGLKVVPRCSVFARYMAKRPETYDLLHPDARAELGIG
ncbi:MAG TPA: GNAT family N-acetyltransferase [Xanthobacteraceae bacterium]|nr:GNAT family N-acetyltransferase [Xanthobacteraceae bacterium]